MSDESKLDVNTKLSALLVAFNEHNKSYSFLKEYVDNIMKAGRTDNEIFESTVKKLNEVTKSKDDLFREIEKILIGSGVSFSPLSDI
jgi:hypothetical protein